MQPQHSSKIWRLWFWGFLVLLMISGSLSGYVMPPNRYQYQQKSESDSMPFQASTDVWEMITPTATPIQVTPELIQMQATESDNDLIVAGAEKISQPIPDGSPTGYTIPFESTSDITLSQVEVIFELSHTTPSDIQVTLKSPSGLETKISLGNLSKHQLPQENLYGFSTMAYLGQSGQGSWSLTLSDLQTPAEGTLNGWQVIFRGHAYQVYLPTLMKSSVTDTHGRTNSGILMLTSARYSSLAGTEAETQQIVGAAVTPIAIYPTLSPPTPEDGVVPPIDKTPGPTATPTPNPALIRPDADFEDGYDRVGWDTFSLRNHGIFFTQDDYPVSLPVAPLDLWAAWLGGDDNELSYIQVDVVIPTDRPYLGHHLFTHSEDPICASRYYSLSRRTEHLAQATANTLNDLFADVGGLIIYEGTDTSTPIAASVIDLCIDNSTERWVEVVYNTRSFAGRLITIRFQTVGDSDLTSSMLIDNVIVRHDFPPFDSTLTTSGSSTNTDQPIVVEPIFLDPEYKKQFEVPAEESTMKK